MTESKSQVVVMRRDGTSNTLTLATGQRHRIVVKRDVLKLLLNDENRAPMGGAKYRIRWGNTDAVGEADAEGVVRFPLPQSCPNRLRVEWGAHSVFEYAYALDIFPDCTGSGGQAELKARLNNLGYTPSVSLQAAVCQFQLDYEVDHEPQALGLVDGLPPAATQSRLDALFAHSEASANA